MFGNNDNQQSVAGTPPAQNPSMLDNVHNPSTKETTAAPATPTEPSTVTQDATQPEHTMTTDNPFVQTAATPAPSVPVPEPIADTSTTVATGTDDGDDTNDGDNKVKIPDIPKPVGVQTSGPVIPPSIVSTPEEDANETTPENKLEDKTEALAIDTNKLADMKKQALDHLEPLVRHLDGTPEETFKTTMMMIQANDNHTLLDKALNAATKITDDKERAQALLDIVNEINYFSQVTPEKSPTE